MSLHVSASTSCNLGCEYCYEEPDREHRGEDDEYKVPDYDMDAILERLRQWKQKYPSETPGLHGGEPMLMADEDIETLVKWVHDNYDGDGGHIQTNATLITDKHIDLFQKYNVSVGISCDGPPELNSERQAREGGEDVTDAMSVKTGRAITRLRESGVSVGIIVVLHEINAGTDEKVETLLSWMDNLARMGVTGHYNPAIPYEDVQQDISLQTSQLANVYVRTWEWMMEEDYRTWNPMRDYQDNLLGLGLGNCVNSRCDVFNAGAAKIIKGNGESTGCGKTWSTVGDGVPFLQGDSSQNEYDSEDNEQRYEMLKQIPGPFTEEVQNGEVEDQGGCKGCKYWNVCQGGCPSSGINEDWRNRTTRCKAKYALYERIEKDMRTMFPNIRLITDYRWNDDLQKLSDRGQLDIGPWGAMNPQAHRGEDTWPSVSKNTPNGRGDKYDMVPDEVEPEMSFMERVEEFKDEYGEDQVTYDKEEGHIHADSDIANQSPAATDGGATDDSDDPNDEADQWAAVNDE